MKKLCPLPSLLALTLFLPVFGNAEAGASHPERLRLYGKHKKMEAGHTAVIRLNGRKADSQAQIICDGSREEIYRIEGASDDCENEIVFELVQPELICGVSVHSKANQSKGSRGDIDGVEFYLTSDPKRLGHPAGAARLIGNTPYLPLQAETARYVVMRFQPHLFKGKTGTAKLAEVSFYTPSWKIEAQGSRPEQTAVLVDSIPGTTFLWKDSESIHIRPESPVHVRGIAFTLPKTSAIGSHRLSISGSLNNQPVLKTTTALMDIRHYRSEPLQDTVVLTHFFEAATLDSLTLKLECPDHADLSLSEVDIIESTADDPAAPATVSLKKNGLKHRINPLVFGSNIEFWLDDDEALNDSSFQEFIQHTPITILRYPGGTESDRYLWKEHRLYDTSYWPFVDGPQTTDTDEMMAFAARTGTEVMFCVNTELVYYDGSLSKAALYAADWVRYCRDKGYRIPYWTIGNEMYWKHHFDAKTYAKVVKAYAKAMKAVDPDILIGVPGEAPVNFIAKMDKVTLEGAEKVRVVQEKREKLQIQQNLYQKEIQRLNKTYRNPEPDPWWPTLFEEAGEYIDMVEVHLYPGNVDTALINKRIPRELARLKQWAEEQTGRDILLSCTEWNLNLWHPPGSKALGMEQALCIGEFLGCLIEGKVDIANYWPLTMRGGWISKALMTEGTHSPLASHATFSLMARNLRGSFLKTQSTADHLYSIASWDAESRKGSLIILTRPTQNPPAGTALSIASGGFGTTIQFTRAICLSSDEKQGSDMQTLALPVSEDRRSFQCVLPQYAALLVHFEEAE